MREKILIDGLYHDIGEPTIYDGSNTITVTAITVTLKHGISKIAGQAVYISDILKYTPVPFKPKEIVIDYIGGWFMNGKPIRKNNIKAGIIKEVR